MFTSKRSAPDATDQVQMMAFPQTPPAGQHYEFADGKGVAGTPLYDAPPRKSYSRTRFGLCGILCCCCIGIPALIILIAWLVIGSIKAPKYSIQDVRLVNYDSNFGGKLWNPKFYVGYTVVMNISCRNPNKVALKNRGFTFNVTYNDQELGEINVDGFVQDSKSETVFRTNITVPRIDTGELIKDLFSDFIQGDKMALVIEGRGRAFVGVMGVYSPKFTVKMKCTYGFHVRDGEYVTHDCDVNI